MQTDDIVHLIAPDRALTAAMNRQLHDAPPAPPVERAPENRLLAVREGVRKLLEEVLERKRKASEREAHCIAAASRADSGIRYNLTSSDKIRFSFGSSSVEARARNILKNVSANLSLGRLLVRYVNERCEGHASWCYQRAGVSRQLYSRIISNPDKRVAKRTVMQLALGLKLNKQEADAFLSAAGYAFSSASYEDQVFAWSIVNGVYNLFDINDLLVKGDCTPVAIN